MPELLVSPEWLHENLDAVRVVDASWYLPAQGRDAKAEYREGHIPGAVYFDIDAIADTSSELPHMLPAPEKFAEAAGALGLSETSTIVVYDGMGLFSAPRVWWTLKTFGAREVRILEGGMPAWKAAGYPLEAPAPSPSPARFTPRLDAAGVADIERVRGTLNGSGEQVVDARPAARFRGEAAEPRAGLKSGHIPGSRNLPFDALFAEGEPQRLVGQDRIRALFEAAGVDWQKPVVTSCGSGVTAAILSFALAAAGKEDTAVYDGSWTEWGGRTDTPVERGEA
ncbi:3-mercaptopyruvate sulfurtransferase [Afifella sp. IM 167]|uniref:3-mercaptopyruvate sulfurtransferase n=1 Tax=Afifella sp. IM 167 TaxID=2033586 RepID=UPI001CCFA017|nr:3-mercaptopyruvate sulfurtransferase [Afifella sp. IM 167]MBZ8132453.1 3-mercaptopyruvate sulfurtransferase [Afifella sp. IM 167]